MGERVEFPSNGHTCQGYLAGKGPGIVVIQEYWGLVKHIEEIVDRFAGEGFSAIAPDLFHGKTATSPDEAGRLSRVLDGHCEAVGRDPASVRRSVGIRFDRADPDAALRTGEAMLERGFTELIVTVEVCGKKQTMAPSFSTRLAKQIPRFR